MSTREKSYEDYGLTKREAVLFIKYCRGGSFQELELLQQLAEKVNHDIAIFLVESIIKKLSYERLAGRYYIPIDKNSFYGYRRKLVAELYFKVKE